MRDGDVAVEILVESTAFSFTGRRYWIAGDNFTAFIAEFDALARTRKGRAALPFMSSTNMLEVFSTAGTSDLVVRGRLESAVYAGGARFPVVLDFHTLLDSEHVGRALSELHALMNEETRA